MKRLLGRAAYRTGQVVHALRPRLDAGGLAAAQELLTPAEQRLFFAMHRRDQRHALAVAARLRADDVDDADLLKAALLHDCGKGDVPVWLRVARVLAPGWVRTAGVAQSAGWRGSAYRLSHHPEIGATLVADAGASGTTVSLIRGRVASEDEGRLAMLLAADDAN